MHTHKLSVACLVLFAAQMIAHADTVYLTDGTQREGTVTEDDSSGVKLRVKHGPLSATVEIPRKEISRVEFKAVALNNDEIDFQLLGKEAERLALLDPQLGAAAWLRYAHFCDEKEGYNGYSKAAYEKVIEFDPNHADARKALGYTFGDEGWTKPKEDTITVGPRFVPHKPVHNSNSITVPATQNTSSETTIVDVPRTNYSRTSNYENNYESNRSNSVIYLGSVNGRLQPISQSQFYSRYIYGNSSSSGNRNSGSYSRNYWSGNNNYSNTSSSTQVGRTGYYSDGYYRSNSSGVMTHYSNTNGTTRVNGTINGGYNSGNYYQSGPGYNYRR